MSDLWKALQHLYPDAVPLVDYELRDDGDGRGAYIAAWRLAQPQPTEADITAAIAAYDTARAQQDADARALRQKIVTVAQSAVGQSIDTLTAGQVRALVAVLLYQAGALDKSGVVQPLGTWVQQ